MSSKYSTNSIISDRYSLDNVVNSEIKSLKKQETVSEQKFKRNVYIEKLDNDGNSVHVGFLHNDGKLKSNIYYNKQGKPIREIYRSNYGIGDYTAISDFIYDEAGNLKTVKTQIDDGAVIVREY